MNKIKLKKKLYNNNYYIFEHKNGFCFVVKLTRNKYNI